jgi:hypothetical protein
MDTETFIDRLARKITDLGLTLPAILVLEAHKPLAFLGSQLLLLAQPTLDVFLPRGLSTGAVDLLADSRQLESLLVKLETGAKAGPPSQEEM